MVQCYLVESGAGRCLDPGGVKMLTKNEKEQSHHLLSLSLRLSSLLCSVQQPQAPLLTDLDVYLLHAHGHYPVPKLMPPQFKPHAEAKRNPSLNPIQTPGKEILIVQIWPCSKSPSVQITRDLVGYPTVKHDCEGFLCESKGVRLQKNKVIVKTFQRGLT